MSMQRVREPLAKAGKTGSFRQNAIAPKQRDDDRDPYKTRHLIEKLFEKRKPYRGHRHPPRQDLILLILSGIHLAAALIWFN